MFGWITRPWKSNTGAGLMLLSLQLGIHPRNVYAPTFSSSSCSFHVRGLLWKWVGGFFRFFFLMTVGYLSVCRCSGWGRGVECYANQSFMVLQLLMLEICEKKTIAQWKLWWDFGKRVFRNIYVNMIFVRHKICCRRQWKSFKVSRNKKNSICLRCRN